MADEGTAEPSGMNLAGAVNEKVMETIQKMDVLSVLQRMVAQTPEDEQSEEIRDKLKGVMEQFYSMSPEEQETFSNQIKRSLAAKISAKLSDPNGPFKLDGLENAIKEAVVNQLIFVGVVGAIIIFLIVFFGYKLYKSIKDKERKKEDKKKAKQQKKKK